jgi:hypothetical protein
LLALTLPAIADSIYYRYDDQYSPVDGGVTYIEVDDGRAQRQITVNGEQYLPSNLAYPHWGMMLAEGRIDDDPTEDLTEISQAEFEAIWAHISPGTKHSGRRANRYTR